jgi:hypothetical protein
VIRHGELPCPALSFGSSGGFMNRIVSLVLTVAGVIATAVVS